MDVTVLTEQVNRLKNEIEEDRKEFPLVPLRFQEAIKDSITSREREVVELEKEIQRLNKIILAERLAKILLPLEEHLNQFLEEYPFETQNDKVAFQNQVLINIENNRFMVSLRDEKENTNEKKASKKKIKVTFPDGNSIEEFKTTDSFTKVILAIGISKVEPLGIKLLKLPLIGRTKSGKYQQREISPNTYLVTQMSNEKKVEILEYISKELKLNLTIELT